MTDYRSDAKRNGFPSYSCPCCKTKTQLDFNPKKNCKKWSDFLCPVCGGNNGHDDYQIVRKIKIEINEEDD